MLEIFITSFSRKGKIQNALKIMALTKTKMFDIQFINKMTLTIVNVFHTTKVFFFYFIFCFGSLTSLSMDGSTKRKVWEIKLGLTTINRNENKSNFTCQSWLPPTLVVYEKQIDKKES